MRESDHHLWTAWRIRKGGEAIGALVQPLLRFAKDLACRVGCDDSLAGDAVQEGLVRLARTSDDRPLEVGLKAWFGRTVILQGRMLQRADRRRARRERRVSRPEAVVARPPRPELPVETVVASLPEPQRVAVVLRFLHDLDYREIAAILGVPEATCRVRVHRGMEALRARLGRSSPALVAALPLPRIPEGITSAALASAASAPTGVAMGSLIGAILMPKAVLTVVAAAAVVAAGVGGWAFLHSEGGDAERVRGEADRASPSMAPLSGAAPRLQGSPSGATDFEKQLEQAQVRIKQLTAEVEAARQQTPTPPIAAQPNQDEMPVAVRDHAVRLRVSEAALTALWRARKLYYGADAATREQLIAPLWPFGEEVVRAVDAVNRGGGGHISLPMVVADLGLAGGGDLLIRMIEEDGAHLGSLVLALPGYDSPRVRTYLVERIARETEPGAFWNLAGALGALQEPRGAEAVRLQQILGL